MSTFKQIFITLIYGCLIGGAIIYFTTSPEEQASEISSYKFDDPAFAADLLDTLEPTPFLEPWYRDVAWPPEFHTLKLITSEDNYCKRQIKFFTMDPSYLFTQDNFFTEFSHNASIVRPLIMGIANDLMPDIKPAYLKRNKKAKYPIESVVFFTHSQYHFIHDVGKHFSCFNQMYNHVPGLPTLQSKDLCAQNVNKYAKSYESRPNCFKLDQYLPRTWIMFEKEDCLDFFNNHFNTQEYQEKKKVERIQFIRKIGNRHRATGVEPVHEEEEAKIRLYYGNGSLCGQRNSNVLMQKYIGNPLLLVGRKFDFRIYMFLASTNPVIGYYHDGFLKLSVQRFNHSSNEKNAFISNTDLAKKIFAEAAAGNYFEGMNETELRSFQTWTLAKLQKYLLDTGKISDPNWLDNYLRPRFKKAMVHFTRATSHGWLKHSSVCEIIGWDYTLDDDLTLWFLEANWNPALLPYSEDRRVLLVEMVTDIFELIFKTVRSRMKRTIHFINKVTRMYPDGLMAMTEKDMKAVRSEYAKISQNYLEPEFQLSPENSLEKIIDENLEGPARYGGYLEEECY